MVATPLCLRNISKNWSVDNMKKTGLNGYAYDFSVDYYAIAVDDILDIHNYLMKKNDKMFGLINNYLLFFIGLLFLSTLRSINLFSLVGIGSYFLYFHWYLKKDVIRINNLMNL